MSSLLQRWAALPAEARARIEASLTPDDYLLLSREWRFWARPEQLPPEGDWTFWLILAGRGFGKTRCGAEWVIDQVERRGARRVALVGPTAADVRDVMVRGESGIIACSRKDFTPTYLPSKRLLVWPNGAIATLFSAEKPERLRGPQHDAAWCDELAGWGVNAERTWSMLQFGLRLGDPRCVITTTPKPLPLFRAILALEGVAVTRGSTFANRANLARKFFEKVIKEYQGTRLGRQELNGELLEDLAGALWKLGWIEDHRRRAVPDLRRVVVAVDPAITSTEDSDETGIIVVGLGEDGRVYVLEDLTGTHPPEEWGRLVIQAFHEHKADSVVAEVNRGGDLVKRNLLVEDPNLPVREVHAARGKATRAEPVATLYERGRVSHVGPLTKLEDELTTWNPRAGRSPNRIDALVWGVHDLVLGEDEPDPRRATAGVEALNRVLDRDPRWPDSGGQDRYVEELVAQVVDLSAVRAARGGARKAA